MKSLFFVSLCFFVLNGTPANAGGGNSLKNALRLFSTANNKPPHSIPDTLAKIPKNDIPSVLSAAAPFDFQPDFLIKLSKVTEYERASLVKNTLKLVPNNVVLALEVMEALSKIYWARRGSIIEALEPLIKHLPSQSGIVAFIQAVDALSSNRETKIRAITLLLNKRTTDQNAFLTICSNPSYLRALLAEEELSDLPGIKITYCKNRTKDDEEGIHRKQ